MHILIAPNAFKNSLDAVKVADAIEEGLQQSGLICTTKRFPIADGGDGTGALLSMYLGAKTVEVDVCDPLGRKIKSRMGWKDDTAIIELADASGLRLLRPVEYAPLHATTFGTGELIAAALDKHVKTILLCIGGSATVDGGAGILRALGVKFLDGNGNELDGRPVSMLSLSRIDTAAIDQRIKSVRIVILCDVVNTLIGPSGAPAVFGPQKGASPDDVRLLNDILDIFSTVALKATARNMAAVKHGGASGGVAAGLFALLNAQLVNGIDQFLEITGFVHELEKASLVITGEGSLDRQTLEGKGPFGVAERAQRMGIPVIGMAGRVDDTAALQQYFDRLLSINEPGIKLEEAIKHTYSNLVRTSKHLGHMLARDGR